MLLELNNEAEDHIRTLHFLLQTINIFVLIILQTLQEVLARY